MANQVVWQSLFDKYRKEIVQSRLLMVAGKLQIAAGVTHLVMHHCFNLTPLLQSLTETDALPQTLASGDETIVPDSYHTAFSSVVQHHHLSANSTTGRFAGSDCQPLRWAIPPSF